MVKKYTNEPTENGQKQYSCNVCGLMYDSVDEAKECYDNHNINKK